MRDLGSDFHRFKHIFHYEHKKCQQLQVRNNFPKIRPRNQPHSKPVPGVFTDESSVWIGGGNCGVCGLNFSRSTRDCSYERPTCQLRYTKDNIKACGQQAHTRYLSSRKNWLFTGRRACSIPHPLTSRLRNSFAILSELWYKSVSPHFPFVAFNDWCTGNQQFGCLNPWDARLKITDHYCLSRGTSSSKRGLLHATHPQLLRDGASWLFPWSSAHGQTSGNHDFR